MSLDQSASIQEVPAASVSASNDVPTKSLQQDAGVFDKPNFDNARRIGTLENFDTANQPKDAAPDDWHRDAANRTLTDSIDNIVAPQDRQTMQAMLTSLIDGDCKGFGDLLKSLAGNPEKLKQLCDQADQILEKNHCTTRLYMTASGKVLVSDTSRAAGHETGLLFNPATGTAVGKSIVQESDGSILIRPGILGHFDPSKAFSNIANNAVNEINSRPTKEQVWPRFDGGHSNWPDANADRIPDWFKKATRRPNQDGDDVENMLEARMSQLIPAADRAIMVSMTHALTHGDANAFAEAVKQCAGDPQKLKALVAEVDKMMEEKGCTTRLEVGEDGKVLISDTNSGTAISIDPANGHMGVLAIEHNSDGSILVQPGELVHSDVNSTFKSLGESAVGSIIKRTNDNESDAEENKHHEGFQREIPQGGLLTVPKGMPEPIEGHGQLDVPPLRYDSLDQ